MALKAHTRKHDSHRNTPRFVYSFGSYSGTFSRGTLACNDKNENSCGKILVESCSPFLSFFEVDMGIMFWELCRDRKKDEKEVRVTAESGNSWECLIQDPKRTTSSDSRTFRWFCLRVSSFWRTLPYPACSWSWTKKKQGCRRREENSEVDISDTPEERLFEFLPGFRVATWKTAWRSSKSKDVALKV